jgi:hypothetical protein
MSRLSHLSDSRLVKLAIKSWQAGYVLLFVKHSRLVKSWQAGYREVGQK